MEEAKRFLHRRWPRAHKQRYSTWRGKQYDNPVVGDFGVFEGPEPSTFRKLGNIASEFGGISTYPFTSFWCTGPQMPDRGVYQYTITPGSKQDDENRRADWMLSTVWTCELVDRDLEWDILLLSVGRLADQYGVAPDKIVLVTRTMSSFDLTASRRKGLRSIVDAAEIALHYNIHLDDYGHLSHHYWSYDGKLLSSEEASEHALAMAKFGLPYPEVEDIEYGVGVTNCLQVRKEDLLP
ncbi:hypothetical protein FRB99_008649 [Tulasnella sp. 403]|nr:hypothetical protein FRB99_008649 [Tulasnella sp. 403]